MENKLHKEKTVTKIACICAKKLQNQSVGVTSWCNKFPRMYCKSVMSNSRTSKAVVDMLLVLRAVFSYLLKY